MPRSFFVVPATNNGRKASNPSDQLRVVLPMVLGRALEVMVAVTLEPSSVLVSCSIFVSLSLSSHLCCFDFLCR